MTVINKKFYMGFLALALILPTPSKNDISDNIKTGFGFMAGSILCIWTVGLLFSYFKKSHDDALTSAIKKNPNIPIHIKTKIIEKTSSWGINRATYLRYANRLPWIDIRPPFITHEKAEATLNASHYGLENAKKRILEYLVAYQTNPYAKGKVLCLVGGPGVGKTSLVKSIAHALERPFALVSTATREETLRGFEYTYASAEPGDFTKVLCATQSQHPLILLDEIDKSGQNVQGLLEALDPEQNSAFKDTFMDFGINLSNVLFMATANNIEKIPQALRDRMEIIQLEAYTFEEKVNIARNYFIPQLTKFSKLSDECIQQLSDCVPQIIKFTSRSSDANDGVRSLRHAISGLVNKQIFNQTVYKKTLVFTPETIKQYLDPYYTQLRLSEPKDIRTYCNNVLRKLDIPIDLFLKIERTIGGLLNYQAAATIIPTYIDWISKYPFTKQHTPDVTLENAAAHLDATHYGLAHIKESILDYLAGYIASKHKSTKIICFAGPSGVGKTTITKSIAEALGRSFTKISFTPSTNLTSTSRGGVEPGELAKALIHANSSNPVILLDELEKSHPSMQNELLALLDPAQNNGINDEYLGFEIDLSDAIFVASVNNLEALPTALRDRMQIIELDPYNREERIAIARNKLIPEIAILMNSSPESQLKMHELVESLVDRFMPFEAGVRALNRSLGIAAEKLARIELDKTQHAITSLTAEDVIDPYFRSTRLSDPKSPYSYCNQLFKHLAIPPDIFKKIDQKIASLTIWKGAESLIPLYAETVAKYPFGKITTTNPTLADAQAQLDKTHAGLTHVKENILDYLAGYIASNQTSTKILCLAGAPGVGKTTAAKSIGESLGRKFGKVSFGSITSLSSQAKDNHDDLRQTGPIAKALIEANSLNPVILLDELDKAPDYLLPQLLELLDPAQNKAFMDCYLGFEMDLSNVMFIASANDLSNIPSSLLNRMQIVEMHPYSRAERLVIAQEKLMPTIISKFNLSQEKAGHLHALVEPILDIILNTEFGVRSLNRALNIAAEKIISREITNPLSVIDVIKSLDPELLQQKIYSFAKPIIGKANGMYAHGKDGGGIHPKLAAVIPQGTGKLILPDNHGKQSQESYRRVLTYVKINAEKYGIKPEIFKETDVVISDEDYFPTEGASAGIVTTVALISALTQRPIHQDIAVTGAIDIYGNTIGVNGYRDKILGTARKGIKKFILPEIARPVVAALKDDFKGLEITFVSHVDEAVNLLLV